MLDVVEEYFLSELSKFGAKVTGIDSSTKSVNIAKQHAKEKQSRHRVYKRFNP